MSIEITKDLTFLPINQTNEMMLVPTIGSTRCGEIFVTNNADKWTFVCSLCQKATNDIGVFVCHVGLDHLNSLHDVQQVKEVIPVLYDVQQVKEEIIPLEPMKSPVLYDVQQAKEEIIPVEPMKSPVNDLPMGDEQKAERNVILENGFLMNSGTLCSRVSKIVDISALTDGNETEHIMTDKNSILTSYSSQEINEVFLIQQTYFNSVQENKVIVNDTYADTSQAQQETIAIDDDEDTNNSNIVYISSPNEDNNDDSNESNDDFKAGSNKRKCNYLLSSPNSTKIRHIIKPLRCRVCQKKFQSRRSLYNHLKAHDEKYHIECPICKVKHKANYFTTHIMTHENNTCFPCQVCGNMHTSREERMEHWKTHAVELPFYCDICYRRFRKPQYLTYHLKSHFQYQCQFCPTKYNAVELQKPPYACTRCENSPDIKQRVQHRRSLANNTHVFDSD